MTFSRAKHSGRPFHPWKRAAAALGSGVWPCASTPPSRLRRSHCASSDAERSFAVVGPSFRDGNRQRLLKIIADVDPGDPRWSSSTPAGCFQETLAYRATVGGLCSASSPMYGPIKAAGCDTSNATNGRTAISLAPSDPDACCRIRKVGAAGRRARLEPFAGLVQRAEKPLSGRPTAAKQSQWVRSGRRPRPEIQFRWPMQTIDDLKGVYTLQPNCPPHPLLAQGFTFRSAGMPCTNAKPDPAEGNPRAGRLARYRGKTECGIPCGGRLS